jgi:hypothetical protein
VFTRTLVEVISEQTEQLNVLWTFYSDNEEDIVIRHCALLDQLEPLAVNAWSFTGRRLPRRVAYFA